ncbi:HAD-IA family hydrolase [Acetivibrio mesophilus]|uniref:HAD family hydrolase n=1 Tax=Acetivibrio mesophilus TaxID=2487273 RepID=A0A4Q0I6F1_9FIRM|nr:HAD-IA family hydrolase [Acetivibrio mesophilus]ODM25024.1 HAD family hydrolase [Clostridium sp. Bc-iso-3]RXE59976.1 HAD family hydrolase [Acetivibrio mesophilus]HHV29437.1 HAD-IA family hydrolase [Clostridium sp.]
MVNTLIFDFDGTIVDSVGIGIEIYNEIAEEYNFKKLNPSDLIELGKLPIAKKCNVLGITLAQIPLLAHKVNEKFKDNISKIKVFDKMKEVLHTLDKEKYSLHIISSNTESTIKEVLQRNDLDIFKSIYSSKNIFGKHHVINSFIKKNSLDKDDILYIGDELRDIEACKKAKVKIISVTWGFESPDLLLTGNPDFLAKDPTDIIRIIKNINNQ